MAKSRKRRKLPRSLQRVPKIAKPFGPKKKRSRARLVPRMTTHKARSAWFSARVTWPVREAPIHALVRERARVAATMAPLAGAADWQLVGPTNVGGRMTSVVCVPDRPQKIWAGAAGGGVWTSDDGGEHWRALWHQQPTLNIGSLAIDPNNAATLYCGTGEANLSADSYPGVGVFRSLDGGENWTLLAPSDTTGIPTRIGSIAVDPFDSNHIRIGGLTHDYNGSDGMFASRDGGLTWSREAFPDTARYWCHAVVFDPITRGTMFAGINAGGSRSGIWKSIDGGTSWTQMANGMPSPELFGRMSLAISPSTPAVLYALAANTNKDEGVLGVFKTADGGANWLNIAGTHFDNLGQMSYGNSIAVHPTDPNHVLCGCVDLHLSTDGGATWRLVSKWDADPASSNYAHADHHCLLMPSAQPGLVYDMNDGGMNASLDGGETWSKRSNGLAATMFYDVDVAQSDGRMFGGGAQDNGTNITFEGKPDEFWTVSGGDGGWTIIDPRAAAHFYTTWQNLGVIRYHGTDWKIVSPPADKEEKKAVWMVFLDMDPNDSMTVFAGGLRVWRSKDDGEHWSAVTDVLDGSPITAVEIASADSKRVFVGTQNGGIYRSLDGGNSWSGDVSGPVPGNTVTRLLTNPTNADIVYATVANSGVAHVFQSLDGGTNWRDIDGGRLPDVPHHAIAIPRSQPSTLYVCSDAGVHVSTDAGNSWNNLTRNLPTVPIVDLVYHEADATLTAASYGRSLWRLKA